MTEDEAERAYEQDDMFIILPHSLDSEDSGSREVLAGFNRTKKQNYSSKNASLISKNELKELLKGF